MDTFIKAHLSNSSLDSTLSRCCLEGTLTLVPRSSVGLLGISSAQVIYTRQRTESASIGRCILKCFYAFTLRDAIAILLFVCFRTVAPAWILNSTLMRLILVPQSSVLAGHPQCHPGAHQNLPTHPSLTQHVSGFPGLLHYFTFSQVTECVSMCHSC